METSSILRSLLVLICASNLVSALAGPTIGPELVFESDKTHAAIRLRVAQAKPGSTGDPQRPTAEGEGAEAARLKNAIMEGCPECTLETRTGKFQLTEYRILLPSKRVWINISVDPGAVEIQTSAAVYEVYADERTMAEVDRHLYGPAALLGLYPRKDFDGHTNIGALSAFPSVVEMANFLQDQMNHPELGLGVLGRDQQNAPILLEQTAQQQEAFLELMERVREGSIRDHRHLAVEMTSKVYYRSHTLSSTASESAHNQAISVKRLTQSGFPLKDAPIEIRYTAGRVSFAHVLLNYRYFLKRIEYLNGLGKQILPREFEPRMLKMSASEKLSRFVITLREMGESLETYRPLLVDKEVRAAQLDAFVSDELIRWKDERKVQEILNYIPDLESSEWVRDRMRGIINHRKTPDWARDRLREAIQERAAKRDGAAKAALEAALAESTKYSCAGLFARMI